MDPVARSQTQTSTVLRSESPELVLQEIWGHLCCHYAIRTMMWEPADHAHVDPDRVSFVAALRGLGDGEAPATRSSRASRQASTGKASAPGM